MRILELFEKHTTILYHHTGIRAGLDILNQGSFKLSMSTASPSESRISIPGYDFFLSTSRTKTGDYHARHSGGVVFNIDGGRLSQKYPVRPLDYWERNWLDTPNTSESEDRVFSKTPEIPIDVVDSIHVATISDSDNSRVRKLVVSAKKRGIPVYVYNNERDWRFQVRSRALTGTDLSSYLTGSSDQTTYYSRPVRGVTVPRGGVGGVPKTYGRSSLVDLVSLIKTPAGGKLPASANERLRRIRRYRNSEPESIQIDLVNARKPSSKEYGVASELVSYMRRNRLDIPGLVKHIIDRWDDQ